MCDDCSESTSTADTSSESTSDTSCDTSTDTGTDTTLEFPEDSSDLSDDGAEDLPEDSEGDLDCEEAESDDCSEEVDDVETESAEHTDSDEENLDIEGADNQESSCETIDEIKKDSLDGASDKDLIESDIEKSAGASEQLYADGSEELPDGDNESNHYSSINDYYSQHNYGQDDYDTYSKDPAWRQLMREQYPDTELPPYSSFGEYYSAHNYGPEDYDKYSQDPDWRQLKDNYDFSQAMNDFTPAKWNDMGLEERQVAINKLSNYCCGNLEIKNNPNITYYNGEKGDYGWSRPGEIGINLNEMGDPIETADTVAHEYRHQYQRERAENPQTAEEFEWRENLKPGNYIRSEVDYWGYLNQPVERDARQYAQRYRDRVIGGSK